MASESGWKVVAMSLIGVIIVWQGGLTTAVIARDIDNTNRHTTIVDKCQDHCNELRKEISEQLREIRKEQQVSSNKIATILAIIKQWTPQDDVR